jgi:phospholipid/cholesterol/gamma-HCH transport system ATP-binding protein
MGAIMISIRSLNVGFSGTHVLRDLNLDIPEGITTFIMGRSGIGKSVLLKTICALIPAEAGHIFIDGEDILAAGSWDKKRIRSCIGMVLQDGALFDGMTVYENIAFPLEYNRRAEAKEVNLLVHKYAEIVGIENALGLLPVELSGGMKRKTALARAMITEPKYLFYDEPTTGLDPRSAGMIESMIKQLCRQTRITSLIVGHDIDLAYHTADRIALLEDGLIKSNEDAEAAFREGSLIFESFIQGRDRIREEYEKSL